jgi:spermidine/putrescine transport system permease protein
MPSAIYLAIFFILPLILVVVMSLLSRGSNPSDYRLPFTISNYTEVFGDSIRPILLRSIWIALLTTFICLLIGYPLAFFIATRRSSWARNVALFLVILPFWTNFLIRTYAWQIILGRRGVFNELLIHLQDKAPFTTIFDWLNLDIPLTILGTEFAVLLGLVYGFLPFMVLPIYANVERFNFHLVEAGHDLGANDWRVFRRVVLPLTMPGVVAGSILVFIPAIGAFVTPALLGGTTGFMIGNLITRQFNNAGGSWPLGSGSSIVIMALVMLSLYLYFRFADEERVQTESRRSKIFWNIGLWSVVGLVFGNLLVSLFGVSWLLALAITTMIAAAIFLMNWLPGQLAQQQQPSTDKVIFTHKIHSPAKIRRDRFMRRLGRVFMWVVPVMGIAFLWLPIVLLVTYSFNASSRAGGRWEGFTTGWYSKLFGGITGTGSEFSTDQLLESIQTTLTVSITATIIATVMGTMIAMAMVRGRFRGKPALDGLLYLPIVIPDITMGISLVVFFKFLFDIVEVIVGQRYFLSVLTVIIAHVAFNIPFVAIVVRARLTDMNPRLEEAARDLGANQWRTFYRVTYPLLIPGIVAGALLAFTISLDDFVVTFFSGGATTTTLTVYVFSLVRRAPSPEINAVSTLMILASTMLILISLLLQGRNASKA